MTMNQLPQELLVQILLQLDPMDRLRCSLTCRRWAEVISFPPLLEDITLAIRGIRMETIAPVLMETRRCYRNLQIVRVSLTWESLDLWEKLGEHLRRLEFRDCESDPGVLWSILQRCPNLESLEFNGGPSSMMSSERPELSGRGFPGGVHEKLHNLRHIKTCSGVTEEFLKHLLELMPSLSSLIVYLDRRPEMGHLPSIILHAEQMYTELEIHFRSISDEDFIVLAKRYSGSLRKLHLQCTALTHTGFSCLGDFTKLRYLSLLRAYNIGDVHLEKLVRNVRDLETLKVWCATSGRTTPHGWALLSNLSRLRDLSLVGCVGVTGYALPHLAMIHSLRGLELKMNFLEPADIQHIACLKDLTQLSLSLSLSSSGFSSENVDIVCENFRKLEHLTLSGCQPLTDGDGVKLRLLRDLKKLRLDLCPGLTDSTFEQGLRFQALESLSLTESAITDAGLSCMAVSHSRLKKLSLYSCKAVTDAGLLSYLRNKHLVHSIVLESCEALTDRFLEGLVNLCPRLEYADFRRCSFSAEARKLFDERRPGVFLESDRVAID